MIGGNVTSDFLDNLANHQYQKMHNKIDDDFKNFAVKTQLDNICKILGGEAKHYTCCDRTTEHEKIVIEYNHQKK